MQPPQLCIRARPPMRDSKKYFVIFRERNKFASRPFRNISRNDEIFCRAHFVICETAKWPIFRIYLFRISPEKAGHTLF